jgi:heterogeneous nuclear ribonucleoprotein A1/A3
MFDHETKRSRGFGFIVFASEQVVDDLLANGNMIDLAGSKVSLQFIIEMTQMVIPSIVYLWCKICKVMSTKGKCILLFQVTRRANFMEHHA